MNKLGGRERSEEEDEAERVVQVLQRVRECRVPLADQVVELVHGPAAVEALGSLALMPAARLADLLEECLLLAELGQQRLVQQEEDVLGEIVRRVAALELLLRLSRVDALEDAELAEVLQRHLQLVDSGRARHVPTR